MGDTIGPDVSGVRDQKRGDRAIARSAEGATLTALVAIVATLGAAWGISYLSGGSKTVGPQLFYAPVLIAATRFGHIGALWVGVLAGVLCGPFLPFDVDAGLEQSLENWTVRLVFFVVIGQVIAALHERSLPVVQERISHRLFRQRLASALDAGEIQAVFQPIVDLGSGQIVGVEALARWYPSEREVVMPLEFIPQAEAAGVITSIDLAILENATTEAVRWSEAGLIDLDHFFVTVNFSGGGFDDDGLARQVGEIVGRCGLKPSAVLIEVTESALVNDLQRAASRMVELKAVGVGLALDDFGVGQSSLAALHRYPVDVVKLDRTFLDLDTYERPEVLEGIVHLANGFSEHLVIAEGIESVNHLQQVRAAGGCFGQGYLFDRPLDRREIVRALDAGAYHLPVTSVGPLHADECSDAIEQVVQMGDD